MTIYGESHNIAGEGVGRFCSFLLVVSMRWVRSKSCALLSLSGELTHVSGPVRSNFLHRGLRDSAVVRSICTWSFELSRSDDLCWFIDKPLALLDTFYRMRIILKEIFDSVRVFTSSVSKISRKLFYKSYTQYTREGYIGDYDRTLGIPSTPVSIEIYWLILYPRDQPVWSNDIS